MSNITDSRAVEVLDDLARDTGVSLTPTERIALDHAIARMREPAEAQGSGEVVGILRTAVEYHRAQATGPCDQFGNKASRRNLKLEAWHRQVADAIEAITAPPSAPVGVEAERAFFAQDFYEEAREGKKPWPAQQPAAVDEVAVVVDVVKCPECHGLGEYCLAGHSAHPSNWYECDACNGTGKQRSGKAAHEAAQPGDSDNDR